MWIPQIVSIDSEIAILPTFFSLLFHPLSHNIGLEFMQKPSSAFFLFLLREFRIARRHQQQSTQFSYHVEILRLFQNSHAPIVRRKEQKHSSQAGIKAGQREKICVCRRKNEKHTTEKREKREAKRKYLWHDDASCEWGIEQPTTTTSTTLRQLVLEC